MCVETVGRQVRESCCIPPQAPLISALFLFFCPYLNTPNFFTLISTLLHPFFLPCSLCFIFLPISHFFIIFIFQFLSYFLFLNSSLLIWTLPPFFSLLRLFLILLSSLILLTSLILLSSLLISTLHPFCPCFFYFNTSPLFPSLLLFQHFPLFPLFSACFNISPLLPLLHVLFQQFPIFFPLCLFQHFPPSSFSSLLNSTLPFLFFTSPSSPLVSSYSFVCLLLTVVCQLRSSICMFHP